MDSELHERIERAAEVHALFNALKHGGSADVGAIMGPLMGENPEFRPHGDEVPRIAGPIVQAVNERTEAERRERLGELAPEKLAELETDDVAEEKEGLPSLPGASEVDTVRLRCAPNPNGPWHLGSARMGAVMGRYAERYDGWLLCRFDDTDPETKRPDPDAYDAILEDLGYLGFEPNAVMRASSRLETYYEHARELVAVGGAYTCQCPAGEFSERKNAGKACPHRDRSQEETTEQLEAMIDGKFASGEIVLRVRTDLSAPNPAERDWVALRMVDRPHPLPDAADYRCWPMLDFQSAIDDHEMGITHIIRGKDLQDSETRQGYLYEYFGWEYPSVTHWGRIGVDEYALPLSTSRIREAIDADEITGWDDPRAPTLRALERRGILGDAVTDALTELGVSESDVDLSMSNIYAKNRERIDADADRYFLVRDGKRIPLVGEVPTVANPPRHPTEDRGTREIPVGEAVLVEADDIPANGQRVWLKGLGCVRFQRDAFELTGEDIEVVRDGDVPVIHWVPGEGTVSTVVHGISGSWVGEAESGVADESVGNVVQFERVGFARIDDQAPNQTHVYFAHR